ncbi:MAG: tRNA (N(6)-L-threonylcarbamoyladenosine(37)-C(2))-methylthiotransferase MtaB [Deltaproteobacteria bacterium]|nr:tRNA (N(6)-L-threonylcarbamoyladenosine(37)-C(2))-methylthiotransferase MtaB [Deltaproteobacteria bacterium]
MSKFFKIITLGCKVNQYESAFIEESLIRKGCQRASQDTEAELVVINTCIVTAKASYQSRQAIRRAVRENPEATIAAIGCYGQVFPEELSLIRGVDLIAGNMGKSSFPDLLIQTSHHNPPLILQEDFRSSIPFEQIPIKRFGSRTRAFLKIQDGCESFCSYCIVPKARGPLRSLEPEKVIRNLRDLAENGYKEAVLTGVHLGKYGSDLRNGVNLTQLLIEIGNSRCNLRIRLSSLEPDEIGSDLIELMATHTWLCRHFHISLQNGDDSVLKRMNRHYSAKLFASVVRDITALVPKVSIGVDVLVGFPGETEEAFNNTFTLLQGLPISYMHVFPYSKREGTPAAKFSGQLDYHKTKERALALRRLDKKKRKIFWSSLVGDTFDVLTEGWAPQKKNLLRGLSDNYARFTFLSEKMNANEIAKVRARGVTEDGVSARPLPD